MLVSQSETLATINLTDQTSAVTLSRELLRKLQVRKCTLGVVYTVSSRSSVRRGLVANARHIVWPPPNMYGRPRSPAAVVRVDGDVVWHFFKCYI